MNNHVKNIVITGSSRGIGFGLATYFLEQGMNVVVVGSTEESTARAVDKLEKRFNGQVFGVACHVADDEQVERLGRMAKEQLGTIDIWINNAGVTQPAVKLHELSNEAVEHIFDVNVYGVINGSKVAVELMLHQGYGSIYNMEGLGSDGRVVVNYGYYGTTKRMVRYFTKVLAKEQEGSGLLIGRLSPGMVITDLLLNDIEKSSNKEKTMKIFRILADRVQDVAPYLGKRILKNRKNGSYIAWLTTPKIFYRFITAGFIKRDPFEEK